MTLGEWVRTKGMSHDDLAARLGCDRSTVSRYVSGHRMPRRPVLERITEITGGEVTANDFLTAEPDDDGDSLAPAGALGSTGRAA